MYEHVDDDAPPAQRGGWRLPALRSVLTAAVLLELIVLPAWLATVTTSAATARTDALRALSLGASGGGAVSLAALPACSNCTSAPLVPGVSVSLAGPAVRAGGGTTAYVGAQRVATPGLLPEHTALAVIDAGTLVLGLGATAVVAWAAPGGDWLTGQTATLGSGSGSGGGGAALPTDSAWSEPVALPLPFPDALLCLSQPLRLVLLVGGGSAVAARVAQAASSSSGGGAPLAFGPLATFYAGVTVDTDTALLLDGASFAVSYYAVDATGVLGLSTVLGSVDPASLAITFSQPAAYAPNHMTHGVAGLLAPPPASSPSLASSAWLLAYPVDNETDPAAQADGGAAMGLVVATAARGSISLWGPGGTGALPLPWGFTGVRAAFFFDVLALTVRAQPALGGVAATVALAFPDAAAAWAIRVLTAQLWLGTDGAGSVTSVDLLWGDLLAATPAGASEGYKFFSIVALFADAPVWLEAADAAVAAGAGDAAAAAAARPPPLRGGARRAALAAAAAPPSSREFALVYSDVSASGSVQATVVRYDTASQALSVTVPELPLAPPFSELDPTGSDEYYWTAAAALPQQGSGNSSAADDGPATAVLVFTSLKAPGESSGLGNLSLLEHAPRPLGVVASASAASAAAGQAMVTVAAAGVVSVPGSAFLGGSGGGAGGLPVLATSRGSLLAAPVAGGVAMGLRPAAGAGSSGVDVVAAAADSCLGLLVSPAVAGAGGTAAQLLLGPGGCG